jgi:hypothetical protein
MREVTCVFNSVNGENTGCYMRTGPAYGYSEAGILIKKNCPNGTFYVDGDDGQDPYYRLLYPERYGFDATPRWVPCKTQWLSNMTWGTSNNTQSNVDAGVSAAAATSSAYSAGLDQTIVNMLTNSKILDDVANNWRIIGAPFQYMESVDFRPYKKYPIGRMYAENILSEAPIVYFVPGVPTYMPDVSNKEREALEGFMQARYSGQEVSSSITAAMKGIDARYFDFSPNYGEYIRYVNALCRAAAIFMGIGDLTCPFTNVKYKNMDWSHFDNLDTIRQFSSKYSKQTSTWDKIEGTINKHISSLYNDIFGDYRYVKMYVDPSSSFNENISNNTTQSQIAGLFDTAEGIAKDIQFFLNGDGSADWASDILKGMSDLGDKFSTTFGTKTTSNFQKLLGLGSDIVSGSNVIFPELWGDSSFSKSYNFTIDLVSPYGTPEAIYLYCIAPIMRILPLGVPRQTSANGFTSPFLVKVFAKGWFSCEMGMIDSIQIEKVNDSWSVCGIPTEYKVTFSVKDLYSNLMVSKSTTPELYFNNTSLIEFIAVNCGVDITKPQLALKIENLVSAFSNVLTDIPTQVYSGFVDNIRKAVKQWTSLW